MFIHKTFFYPHNFFIRPIYHLICLNLQNKEEKERGGRGGGELKRVGGRGEKSEGGGEG